MLSRRKFLTGLGCSLAASPFVTPAAFAALPTENRLVVIILRGAMDGLDALQPYGDPHLAALRPGFDIGPEAGAIDLDGFHAMHGGLSALTPLWQREELGFVQAVSTPYRDKRSHFDGQDILEAGTPGLGVEGRRDGWLNRLLAGLPGAEAQTAFSIGHDEMFVLRGDAPFSSWAPDAGLDLAPATEALIEHVYASDPLFQSVAREALFFSEFSDRMMEQGPQAGRVSGLFEFAATQLRADARIAALSIGGWDSHRNQAGQINRALSTLARAIETLRVGLGPAWERTVVLAMTEFGRTAAVNGTKGTDHGTGGAMLTAGGAVRGGRVLGDWPGLAEADLYARRDLMPTADLRAYAALALQGLFNIDQARLETEVFPGLEMGPRRGLLR